jgi:endonuclease/exonuclease/phosphatase family metal-dependent hydrolase
VSVKQIYPLIALAVLLAGGWFFFSNFRVDVSDPVAGPQVRPRDPGTAASNIGLPPIFGNGSSQQPTTQQPPFQPPANVPVSAPGRQAPAGGDVIRIASFNIQVFGEAKLAKPEVVQTLVNIVRNFDIVAIQEVRAQSQMLLPSFVQAINSANLRYDYVIGERLGRSSSKEQYAYVFNTDTVEVDRRTLYTVSDPDDLLHREPLVAWFRCRNADPQHAFTFSLVNIHTDPDEVAQELNVLDDVFRAVREDGRGEDDVILLGDFNARFDRMGHLSRLPGIFFTITTGPSGALLPTNVRGNEQYDNLVFDSTATQEFMGRGGVFDFMREYNLSLNQAQTVSDHLPVWGEFSVYEGGVPGRVAARPNAYQPQPRTGSANQYPSQPNYAPNGGNTRNPGYADAPLPYNPPRYNGNTGINPDPRYAPPATYTADPRYPGDYNYGRGPSPAPANGQPRSSRPTSRW